MTADADVHGGGHGERHADVRADGHADGHADGARAALAAHAAALGPIRRLAEDVDPARVGPYRGYAEVIAWLDGLAQAGGASGAGDVRVRHIGATVEGQPLFAVEVGPPAARAASAVLAGLHPIEWIGVEIALSLIERLAADPPRDRRVIAFPLINADGYRQVEADLRAGRLRWRRSNARGVDLNRNWPTYFRTPGRTPGRVGLRGWLAGYGNGGPHPLSEPETAAVARALDDVARDARIEAAVSLHSIGRMLLYPYGGRWKPPRELPRLVAAARAVQSRLARRYTVRQCARWLPGALARGMEIDHLHLHHGAAALLVECSLGGLSPRDAGSLVQPFRWFNPARPGPEVADVTSALEPFVRGHDAAATTAPGAQATAASSRTTRPLDRSTEHRAPSGNARLRAPCASGRPARPGMPK